MCCIPACVGDEDDGCGQGLPPTDPAGSVGPDQIYENQMRIRRSPFVLDLQSLHGAPWTSSRPSYSLPTRSIHATSLTRHSPLNSDSAFNLPNQDAFVVPSSPTAADSHKADDRGYSCIFALLPSVHWRDLARVPRSIAVHRAV